MIDLTKLDHVKSVQQNLRQIFDNPSGQEAMKFLEQMGGWYDFNSVDRDQILIGHGKRQLLASIKTLLDLPAEQVVALAKAKEV